MFPRTEKDAMTTSTDVTPRRTQDEHNGSGLADVLRCAAADAADEGRFPLATIDGLARAGLLGLVVPHGHGGCGGGLAELAEVAADLAAVHLPAAIIWVMHCQQADAVARFGSDALRATLLPRVCAGMYLGSITTESTHGGNIRRAAEALEPAGSDVFRLCRHAPTVTGGRHAGGFLVKMRTSPDARPDDVSLVYVDRSTAAIDVSPPWTPMGMAACENVEMTIEAEIDGHALVGGAGGFPTVAIEAFAPLAHVGWSAAWLGAARARLGEVVRLLRRRSTHRVDIDSPLTHHRLGRIRHRLEVVSAYLSAVVDEVTTLRSTGTTLGGTAIQIHLNTLKVVAAEECVAAVDGMIELCGLNLGYLRDSPVGLERSLRELRSASLTFDNTRLTATDGRLTMLDPAVGTVGGNSGPTGGRGGPSPR